MLDSLVRVSRRVAYNHYASILAEARSSVRVGCIAPRAITLPERSYVPKQLDSSKELHMNEGGQSHTGFSPSMTSCSKELRPVPRSKHLLQITTRALRGPDFKFELLPLRSPLLR